MKGSTFMKSKVETMIAAYAALLSDVQCTYPSARGLMRDLSRITLCANSRGLAFFTLDLPSMDSFLLQTLENGRLPAFGVLSHRKSTADLRPRFLWDLWSRVVSTSGCLYEEPDVNCIFFLRQIFCLFKKLELACSESRIAAALEAYHDIESSIRPPRLAWDEDDLGSDSDISVCSYLSGWLHTDDLVQGTLFPDPGLAGPDRTFLTRLDRICGILVTELGLPNIFDEPREWYKHGPGAVADGTSHTYKYDFPHWPAKLEASFPYHYSGSYDLDSVECPSLSEPPSRLIAVPKTAKGPRLIASEPICHQWSQQWIFGWLRESMKSALLGDFIDFADQAKSQDLVVHASIHGDLATLDLSSASDRVSCRHVEALLRRNPPLLRLCHAVRTRWVRDSISNPPIFRKLRKFAAMGSALTFPIQSIFFLCIALASAGASTREDILRLKGKVRVFGDDIIIPVEAYDDLVRNLTLLGLRVNLEKSFHKGFFRESCGQDSYRGFDVTPVKPKHVDVAGPESYQAVCDTANNLHIAGCWHLAHWFGSRAIYRGMRPSIVPVGSALSGVYSFSAKVPVAPVRWNKDLCRHEYKTVQLVSKQKRTTLDRKSTLSEFFFNAARCASNAPVGSLDYILQQDRSIGHSQRPVSALKRVWRDGGIVGG